MHTRDYLSPEDVQRDIMQRSTTRSVCPCKGVAAYWTATCSGTRHPDVARTYSTPLPRALALYPERVEEVRVDGTRV